MFHEGRQTEEEAAEGKCWPEVNNLTAVLIKCFYFTFEKSSYNCKSGLPAAAVFNCEGAEMGLWDLIGLVASWCSTGAHPYIPQLKWLPLEVQNEQSSISGSSVT